MTLLKSTVAIFLLLLVSSFTLESKNGFLPTSLKVTVLDDLGNVIEGCEVTLYATKKDYKAEVNPIVSQLTDKHGKTVFKKVNPTAYFVHATMGEKNNIGSGVLTQVLQEGRTNKVNTIID